MQGFAMRSCKCFLCDPEARVPAAHPLRMIGENRERSLGLHAAAPCRQRPSDRRAAASCNDKRITIVTPRESERESRASGTPAEGFVHALQLRWLLHRPLRRAFARERVTWIEALISEIALVRLLTDQL